MNPEDLSALLSNNRITELCFSLSLLHEVIPPLSVLESFVTQLPRWLASFRHLENLSIWIPISCAEGTGPQGENEGPTLYDNTMKWLINSNWYSAIVRTPFRLASLFPNFFKADEDSKPIYCEYGRWDWEAKRGIVMDWSKVAKYSAEDAYLLEEVDSEKHVSEEDEWEDVSENDESEEN